MGIRNKKQETLRRLDSKTLDARFLNEIRNGLNCSPFEAEAVLEVVKEVYFPFLDEQSVKAPPGKVVKGWWIGWYESGKRKAKALPSKALAEHYRQIKYTQLNSDVFTGTVAIDWPQMRDEYVHSKKVAGCVEASIYEVALTLRHFERLVGRCNSKQIKQNAIDKYILERGKEVIRSTVNKDIRNLRAFINWCRKNRYVNGEVEIRELKEDERPSNP